MGLGEQLRNARLSLNLTASQVAEATRIKVQMVEQIEQEDFKKVAAPIYGKGFIKLYAEYVGIDPKPLIDEYMFRFVDHVTIPSTRLDASAEYDMADVLEAPVEPEETAVPEAEAPKEHQEEVKPVARMPVATPPPPPLEKPEHSEPDEDDSFGPSDLFDVSNVSKQAKARSLSEEAGREMDQVRSEIPEKSEELEEPRHQSPERSSVAEIFETITQKLGGCLDLVKSKSSGLLQKSSGLLQKVSDSDASKVLDKVDFFNNPKLMVSAGVVFVAVLILLLFAFKKPSTTVPDGQSVIEELELVEEPPAPYVD